MSLLLLGWITFPDWNLSSIPGSIDSVCMFPWSCLKSAAIPLDKLPCQGSSRSTTSWCRLESRAAGTWVTDRAAVVMSLNHVQKTAWLEKVKGKLIKGHLALRYFAAVLYELVQIMLVYLSKVWRQWCLLGSTRSKPQWLKSKRRFKIDRSNTFLPGGYA